MIHEKLYLIGQSGLGDVAYKDMKLIIGALRSLATICGFYDLEKVSQLSSITRRILELIISRRMNLDRHRVRLVLKSLFILKEDLSHEQINQFRIPEVLGELESMLLQMPEKAPVKEDAHRKWDEFFDQSVSLINDTIEGFKLKSHIDAYLGGNLNAGPEIDVFYWRVVNRLIKKVFPPSSDVVTRYFCADEKLLLNFGFWGEHLTDSATVISDLAEYYTNGLNFINKDIEVLFLSDYLERYNEKYLLMDERCAIEAEIATLNQDTKDLRQKISMLRKYRTYTQKDAKNTKKLTELDQQMQKTHWFLLENQFDTSSGKAGINCRQQVVELKREMAKLKRSKEIAIVNGFDNSDLLDSIGKLDSTIYKLFEQIMHVGHNIRMLSEKLTDNREKRKKLLERARSVALLNQVKFLRSAYETISENKNRQKTLAFNPASKLIDIQDLYRELKILINLDSTIFETPLVKSKGMPFVLLMPGMGQGMFCPASHSFVIPLCAPSNLRENILIAAAQWRMETDTDCSMQNGYIKACSPTGTMGLRVYRNNFTSDYVKWMRVENPQFAALPVAVNEWFTKFLKYEKDDKLVTDPV